MEDFTNNQRTETATPLVTVIVPVYNTAKYLDDCITSILWQSHRKLEILVIDDTSTDDSLKRLRHWQSRDDRIIVLEQHKNQGVASARNRGVEMAQGMYIAFLDSDDIWHPLKIERQLAAISNYGGNSEAAYCDKIQMSESGISRLYLPRQRNSGNITAALSKSNITGNGSTVLVTTELARKVGPFIQDCSCEDWHFAIRASNETNFAYSPDILVGIRLSDQSRSAQHSKMLDSILNVLDLNASILKGESLKSLKGLWCAVYFFHPSRNIDFSQRIGFGRKSLSYHSPALLTVLWERCKRIPVYIRHRFKNEPQLNLHKQWDPNQAESATHSLSRINNNDPCKFPNSRQLEK